MTVNELLSGALILYMQGGKGQELSYISRSESSPMGWYFWLKHSPGVYEVELQEDGTGELPEKEAADFYVRYYPAREEPVLESYSVAEQILRFDPAVFDDSLITVGEEEHEICPCCAAAQMDEFLHGQKEECTCSGHFHGHDRGIGLKQGQECGDHGEHRHDMGKLPSRSKGIPRMLKKFNLDKNLFVIGKLAVKTEKQGFEGVLKTQARLVRLAPDGITVRQDGKLVEIVEKNGVDRNVPGYELGKRFMEFWGGQFLATMSEPEMIRQTGTERRNAAVQNVLSPGGENPEVLIQYIWQRRQCNECNE